MAAAYRRVYDSRHLQADCQERGSAREPIRSIIEYGLPLLGLKIFVKVSKGIFGTKTERESTIQ